MPNWCYIIVSWQYISCMFSFSVMNKKKCQDDHLSSLILYPSESDCHVFLLFKFGLQKTMWDFDRSIWTKPCYRLVSDRPTLHLEPNTSNTKHRNSSKCPEPFKILRNMLCCLIYSISTNSYRVQLLVFVIFAAFNILWK